LSKSHSADSLFAARKNYRRVNFRRAPLGFARLKKWSFPTAEPVLRARITRLKSIDFGFLGAEPLHSDLPSEGKNVLSEAFFSEALDFVAKVRFWGPR